jgi:hypothetical protein
MSAFDKKDVIRPRTPTMKIACPACGERVALGGSIDSARVRELVEEILEGGREAFEMRRLKYGF